MKTTSNLPNDATLTIHREGYPTNTLHFNLPMFRENFKKETLQAIADDIALNRCSGCNYVLTANLNEDGSFTIK